MGILKTCSDSWKKCIASRRLIVIATVYDAAFLFLAALVTSLILRIAVPSVSSLFTSLQAMESELSIAASNGQSVLSVIFADANVVGNVRIILGTFLLVIFALYLLWVFIEGLAWYQAHKINEKKPVHFKSYLKQFSDASLVWFGIFTLVLFAMLWFVFFALVRPQPLLSSTMIVMLSNIINVLVFVLACISLAQIPSHSLKQNIKNTFSSLINPRLISALFISVFFIAANISITFWVASLIKNPSVPVQMTIGIIRSFLVLPFITFSRVYLTAALKR